MNALILRTCNADMTSYGGFVWPRSGHVSAPDWDPAPKCGGGLHGLLWGEGNGQLLNWLDNAVWLVAVVDTWVELDGKVKFHHADVVHCGDQKSATDYIIEHGAAGERVVGAFVQGGDNATVSGGAFATVSGGEYATVSGGYQARVSGGDYATVSGGYQARVSGGDFATVSGGAFATVSGGNRATVSGGNRATVSGGYQARVSGGFGAVLSLGYWDDRPRTAIAYVGEEGIRPNTFYRLNYNYEFEEVRK